MVILKQADYIKTLICQRRDNFALTSSCSNQTVSDVLISYRLGFSAGILMLGAKESLECDLATLFALTFLKNVHIYTHTCMCMCVYT